MKKTVVTHESLIKARRSKIHGTGVFAVSPIRKGTRLIEYIGERVSHREADERYEDKPEDDNHTFLFIVNSRTVIDAGVGGNDARFINHGCDPNCETVIEDSRVFIDAIRNIRSGDELFYDYMIKRDRYDPPNVDAIYACRCGAKNCRGTMLEPKKLPRPKKKAKGKAGSDARTKAGRGRSKPNARAKATRKDAVKAGPRGGNRRKGRKKK